MQNIYTAFPCKNILPLDLNIIEYKPYRVMNLIPKKNTQARVPQGSFIIFYKLLLLSWIINPDCTLEKFETRSFFKGELFPVLQQVGNGVKHVHDTMSSSNFHLSVESNPGSLNRICFALRCSRQPLNQSDAQLKPIATRLHVFTFEFSLAPCKVYLCSDWLS